MAGVMTGLSLFLIPFGVGFVVALGVGSLLGFLAPLRRQSEVD